MLRSCDSGVLLVKRRSISRLVNLISGLLLAVDRTTYRIDILLSDLGACLLRFKDETPSRTQHYPRLVRLRPLCYLLHWQIHVEKLARKYVVDVALEDHCIIV